METVYGGRREVRERRAVGTGSGGVGVGMLWQGFFLNRGGKNMLVCIHA